jgi:general secretion pathway protein I
MPRNRGFTLIEVLAALMIFSLTAVVLGGAYLNVLNSYEVAQRSNANDGDVYFARAQLLAQADLAMAQAGAEFDDGDRHVKWAAEIDPANTTDLFNVTFTCTVSGSSVGPSKAVAETFMLLRPTWSDPAARSELRSKSASRIALAQGKLPK